MALLFMFWGGVTPAPGSARVARGRRFCARATRIAALGERPGSVGDGTGEAVRRRKVLRVERMDEESGRGAIVNWLV